MSRKDSLCVDLQTCYIVSNLFLISYKQHEMKTQLVSTTMLIKQTKCSLSLSLTYTLHQATATVRLVSLLSNLNTQCCQQSQQIATRSLPSDTPPTAIIAIIPHVLYCSYACTTTVYCMNILTCSSWNICLLKYCCSCSLA